MHALILAAALANPVPRAADAALATYMKELAAAQRRWAQMAELRVAGKGAEARKLARPLPAVLAKDYERVEAALLGLGGWSDPETARWADWAVEVNQPALAAQLYQRNGAQATFAKNARDAWFQACVQAGDLGCVARLLPDLGNQYERQRVGLNALVARTLTPADALDTRAEFNVRGGRPSPTLALERWALRPLGAADKIKRLKLLADVLPLDGQRLAREALIADPDTPAQLFVGTIRTLAAFPQHLDQKLAYWSTLANDVRASKDDRSRATLQMGLIRSRQGQHDEALALFRQVMSFKGADAATAALQVGHTFLRRGEYEAALAAYREAESEYGCSNATGSSAFVPCALYQGICLERLGRIREAMAEYALVMFDAPLWWRTPLPLHLVELYEAAGRLDVLQRTLDGLDDRRYRETIPIRTLMIVHRLERDGDWNSLLAHMKNARGAHGPHREHGGAVGAAAHALARHCEDTLRLLPPDDVGSWFTYVRARCGGESEADKETRAYLARQETDVTEGSDVRVPEIDFPPVKPVDLPDPIVCAEHMRANVQAGAYKPPCP